jgi:DNA recombination protein RmuC
MRETVDEKLQATLEQRLGESFRHVSERLEQVQLGLGEMRARGPSRTGTHPRAVRNERGDEGREQRACGVRREISRAG